MSRSFVAVTPEIAEYIRATTLHEAPILARLREETAKLPMAMMQISPEQGQFMQLLTRLTGARRYIEVGTFTGYSALAVALAMPADGRAVCCDVNAEWTAIGRRFWQEAGVAAKIDLRLAPGTETLEKLRAAGGDGSYDLAFIDADKANYVAYYEHCVGLVRANGVILVDNVLWGGKVADPAVETEDTRAIRALNTRVAQDPRVEASLLPIGDGLLMARKR
jgi:predicted O-methyltransferase YrrM